MKRIYIMMSGMPGSGKTVSSNELAKYLKDKYHLKPYILNKDNIRKSMFGDVSDQTHNAKVHEEYIRRLNKWAAGETSFDVLIDDNTNINYFKRRNPMRIIFNFEENIIACAISFNRDSRFCRKNNESRLNTGGVVVPPQAMKFFERNYQQPVYDEGFHVVYHIDGTYRIKAEKITEKIFKFIHDDYYNNGGFGK